MINIVIELKFFEFEILGFPWSVGTQESVKDTVSV